MMLVIIVLTAIELFFDFGRRWNRRQVHWRRRHGLLECPGSANGSRLAWLRRRAAGGEAHGARQQRLGDGRTATNPNPDRCVYRKPYPDLLSEESAKLAR
jgi:hypothetical protein